LSLRACPPGYLASFGGSLLAKSLFASDIYFWLTTGYFGVPAEAQPLLHAWSGRGGCWPGHSSRPPFPAFRSSSPEIS
jgi:hypothetical protein